MCCMVPGDSYKDILFPEDMAAMLGTRLDAARKRLSGRRYGTPRHIGKRVAVFKADMFAALRATAEGEQAKSPSSTPVPPLPRRRGRRTTTE